MIKVFTRERVNTRNNRKQHAKSSQTREICHKYQNKKVLEWTSVRDEMEH